MSSELSPKRRAFCREFVLDSNGTAAAIRAGFSERSARAQASQMLDMPSVKEEIKRLQADAAEARNVSLDRLYALLGEALQIARRKESATGMVAVVREYAELAGLKVAKMEDVVARAKLQADLAKAANDAEVRKAAEWIGDALESVNLPRTASPAQLVGALAERPAVTPEAFRLLHEAAKTERVKQ